MTEDPDVADKPAEGDQEYVVAPDAVRITLPPGKIVGDDGLTVMVGSGLTVATPVTMILSATPVEEKTRLPEAPLDALERNLTYILVVATVPATGFKLRVPV